MAEKEHGTSHLFGIDGSYTAATVTDFSEREVQANDTTVKDENGNVILRRLDDVTKEYSVSVIQRDTFAAPVIGNVFTYNTIKMIITEVTKTETNEGYRTCDFKGEDHEYITLA